jgi:hypothetical protein
MHVPPGRPLIGTAVPDPLLPEARVQHPLTDPMTGQPINHPANLATVYGVVAEKLGEPVERLADRVEQIF